MDLFRPPKLILFYGKLMSDKSLWALAPNMLLTDTISLNQPILTFQLLMQNSDDFNFIFLFIDLIEIDMRIHACTNITNSDLTKSAP